MLSYLLTNPTVVISLLAVLLLKLFPPKTINAWYGFRTARSMKNERSWFYAQRYSATLAIWLLTAVLLLQCGLFFYFGRSMITDMVTLLAWALALLVVILKTQSKLKKENNGN